jgi:hypothetical protein
MIYNIATAVALQSEIGDGRNEIEVVVLPSCLHPIRVVTEHFTGRGCTSCLQRYRVPIGFGLEVRE